VISQPIRTDLWGAATARAAAVTLAVMSDDQTLARRAAATLEREGKVVRIEAAGPDASAFGHLGCDPDLVLLRRLANRPGIEHELREARRRLPRSPRIVVLPSPGDVEVGRLLAAGAHGLVPEAGLERVLGAVVDVVTAGFVCVPAAMRRAIDPPSLSHRERQILALAITGRTNAEIADRLFISESTVKTHLGSAYRQLGVHTRRDAAGLVLGSDGTLRRSVLGTLGPLNVDAPGDDR
jgi:DNA-binding NarL/FixJ family response regulator